MAQALKQELWILDLTVVTAFDQRLLVPAAVCFDSLLELHRDCRQLEIIVLFSSSSLDAEARGILGAVVASAANAKIRFIDVGLAFEDAFEIRGITVPTYYRLLLPSLLPDKSRVLYLDVDTVVTSSLRQMFAVDMARHYIAGVRSVFSVLQPERVLRVGADPEQYVNAGVLVMNLDAMRQDGLEADFLQLAKRQLEYQDQDVLNIRCRDAILHLHPRYNLHCMFDYEQNAAVSEDVYSGFDWRHALDDAAVLHYAGAKPWDGHRCWYYDQWWSHYRASRVFSGDYYRSHQRRFLQTQLGAADAVAKVQPPVQLTNAAGRVGRLLQRVRRWAGR